MGKTNSFACVVEIWSMYCMKHHSVLYVRSVGNVQHIHDWGLTFCSHFVLPVPRQITCCTECCMISSPLNDMAAFASVCFNPWNPELNPICYLLALLGAYDFLHVSKIRVKSLTLRLLMSYIYGAPILDVSRSHTTTQHRR